MNYIDALGLIEFEVLQLLSCALRAPMFIFTKGW